MNVSYSHDATSIAIIGMAGRFPGARNIDEYWRNLRDAIESITFLTDQQVEALGVATKLRDDPNYVKAAAFLDDYDLFDASFFGMSHREAEITDPQHRVFLECAWEACEMAGYNVVNHPEPIAVYGGATINTYLLYNLLTDRELIDSLEPVQINIGNGGDFLTTRVSYKLNLKGPSHLVQSACSTSLTAVHLACQSLLNEECDMALAGGVSINVGQRAGYKYSEGGMASPDGRCRAFDARAQGTIFGSGVGVVVLKRLVDALADRDTIHAVIKGAAINNDGSLKVGYTAPSIDGQSAVIVEALAMAGVDADTIGYIEAHGTGTPLGDPVEIAALTRAFRASTNGKSFCAVGSVKTNIGHLDAAAGIAGLIKTVLAIKHRQLPPSLHYQQPNPQIDFDDSPFYVNNRLQEWRSETTKLRAGVSSFGVGGTNAHVILEEAPAPEPGSPSRPWQLLTLSARTDTALTTMANNLAAYLTANADLNLADVAYTLQVGRKGFTQRGMVIARDVLETVEALKDPGRLIKGTSDSKGQRPSLTFMFTGQGSQYINMGRRLYEHEPLFRQEVDRCASILREQLGVELLTTIYPESGAEEDASRRLQETATAQPALFIVEYALTQLWLSWGIQPQALAGHSIGEYVAACLAGVFTLEDALLLVTSRGRLMQEQPGGEMLAVPLSELELQPFLCHETTIAAINGPQRCTVAGLPDAIERLRARLRDAGISFRQLQTSHAFHSPMMEPARRQFGKIVSTVRLRPPRMPYLSNLTGEWIKAEEATDPAYWADHICATVRFADNLAAMLADEQAVLLELGPGQTLTRLARQHPASGSKHVFASALRRPEQSLPEQSLDDTAVALTALGQLWLAGIEPDWKTFYRGELRRRVSLPTYPFDRQRYWVEPARRDDKPRQIRADTVQRSKPDDWFYTPAWQRLLPKEIDHERLSARAGRWLLFADESGVAEALNQWLKSSGQSVAIVRMGEGFKHEDGGYTINPSRRGDYELLARALSRAEQAPDVIVHLWLLTGSEESLSFMRVQERGLFSLIYLLQTMAPLDEGRPLDLQIVANQLFALTPGESLCLDKATLLGAAQVIPHEFPSIRCQILDVSARKKGADQQMVRHILGAALDLKPGMLVYRDGQCWEQTYQAVFRRCDGPVPLRPGGAYLLTGGLLGIGFEIARRLAETLKARLILLEDENFPQTETWDEWLATGGANDEISRRIHDARHLSQLGAEVLVLPVNVADPQQLADAVGYGVGRFGPLNGVIHNAHVLDSRAFRTIKETGVMESQWHFVPKVYGTMNLARAVADQPLDFCLLNSSLSSIVGGIGMISCASANSFMNAFAGQQNRLRPGRWISAVWDAWQNTKIATVSPEWAEVALTSEEGIGALTRLLTMAGSDQVIVSTVDLWARIERGRQQRAIKNRPPEKSAAQRHPRPQLPTPYVLPQGAFERAVAEIWQKVLGVEKIGALDNFFDLGGDSLLAIKTAAELRNALQIEIPIVSMYEELTVRSLARLLEEIGGDDRALARDGAEASAAHKEKKQRRQSLQQKQRARRDRPA